METEIQPEAVRPRAEKMFLLVFVLLIAGSIGVTYWKIMVKRDYVIMAQADCDPYEEKCFVHICDPDPAADGEWCTGDPEEDTWYTKNIRRMAYNIPDCDPNDEDCAALVCEEGEENCSYEYCDGTNVPEGDTCNDPVRYAIDNPAEDEEAECDPETEEDCVIEEGVECDPETDDCAASEGTECDPATEDCNVEENPAACDPETEDCAVDGTAECDPATEDCSAGDAAECDPTTEDCGADGNSAAGESLSVSDGINADSSCQSDADGVCPLGKE